MKLLYYEQQGENKQWKKLTIKALIVKLTNVFS